MLRTKIIFAFHAFFNNYYYLNINVHVISCLNTSNGRIRVKYLTLVELSLILV